jgi:nicotinamidase/pyrazinamidase
MRLDASKDALLVIDLQPDFMPGGALPVPDGHAIAEPIGRLARRFETVVATQDWHPAGHVSFASSHAGRAPHDVVHLPGGPQHLWPEHCVQGTAGARVHPALPDEAVTLYLRKGTHTHTDSYSAFRGNPGPDGVRRSTGLAAWLHARGIDRVFVVGLARDFCVRGTAVDAADEGFETFVVDDLTRAVAPERAAEVDAAFDAARVRRLHSRELA